MILFAELNNSCGSRVKYYFFLRVNQAIQVWSFTDVKNIHTELPLPRIRPVLRDSDQLIVIPSPRTTRAGPARPTGGWEEVKL